MLPPTYEPAATGHVPEILELIGQLVAGGHAYPAADGSGDVYFDVRSWPSYGELTRQKIDDMEAAEDADPRGKRDPRDFALWKGWKKALEPETAAWPSPYGPGRPGWHIECSAMAAKYLGPAFDIHGGGVDLRFPHHENELAQSRAAGQPFASYWLHNAWITTAGEKMSKSLGNSLLIPGGAASACAASSCATTWSSAHYRSHVEFSFEALDEAAQGVPPDRELPGARRERPRRSRPSRPRRRSRHAIVPDAFAAALDDDLGTPAAIAVIHEHVREGNRRLAGRRVRRRRRGARSCAMLDVLGLNPADPAFATPTGSDDAKLGAAVDALVAGLLEERAAARADKDWTRADAIRDRIAAAGIEVEDTPDGPKWTVR